MDFDGNGSSCGCYAEQRSHESGGRSNAEQIRETVHMNRIKSSKRTLSKTSASARIEELQTAGSLDALQNPFDQAHPTFGPKLRAVGMEAIRFRKGRAPRNSTICRTRAAAPG